MYFQTSPQITKIRLCPYQLQNRKVPHLRKVRKPNKLFKSAYLRICETYLRNLFGTRIVSYNMFLRRKISYHMNVIFLFFIRSYIFPEKKNYNEERKMGRHVNI